MKRSHFYLILLYMLGMIGQVYAQDVKVNTNFVVESDGTVRLDAGATSWDDLRVPLTEPSTGEVKPDWVKFDGGAYLNYFKPSGIDEMYFVVQLPHNWKEGTDIKPHIHWFPETTSSGAVRWGIQYTWSNIGSVFPSYTTVYGSVTVPDESPVQNKHYLTPLTSISGSGKTLSSMLVVRIFRDGSNAADTYGSRAAALEVDFHYEIDTFGSRSEYTK